MSDTRKKLGFSGDISTDMHASKVSLVLDRLEARKILERRRRGMSNVIVLK